MTTNYAVIGLQWGDEGKGKIVDLLSKDLKVAVRYQGGHNAGHTILFSGRKLVLHLIPSGVLHPDVTGVIDRGVVVDPEAFLREKEELEKGGLSLKGRLFLSKDAHMILPYHSLADGLGETLRGSLPIGTTRRGIGPCYEDKLARRGVKLSTLLDPKALREALEAAVSMRNPLHKGLNAPAIDIDKEIARLEGLAEGIRPFIVDTFELLDNFQRQGRSLLFEGAQGTLLDIDFGTYPFVSSSHPSIGGIFTGSYCDYHIPLKVIGLVKAYTTRVGEGPFPTEERNEIGKTLQERGHEYGATTGRPRRCGWLDLVALKYAVKLNGVSSIALTKVDVLDSFASIPVCTSYLYKGERLSTFPTEPWILEKLRPEYTELRGWQQPSSSLRNGDPLPEALKEYIAFLEEKLEVPVSLLSVGPDREETLNLRPLVG